VHNMAQVRVCAAEYFRRIEFATEALRPALETSELMIIIVVVVTILIYYNSAVTTRERDMRYTAPRALPRNVVYVRTTDHNEHIVVTV